MIFLFQVWAGLFDVVPLACCVVPLFGFLSHWITRHYPPLLVLIKIIIVKFLLKITTLKIQSDCFGIKRSWKHPKDCSLQQALHIYYHTWRWDVIKDRKFQPSLVDKRVIKMWILLGHFAGVRPTFGRLHHIVQKIVKLHDLAVDHWTLCGAKTKCNNDFKCFYVEPSLLSHCKPEKSWSCKITK